MHITPFSLYDKYRTTINNFNDTDSWSNFNDKYFLDNKEESEEEEESDEEEGGRKEVEKSRGRKKTKRKATRKRKAGAGER